MTTPVDSQTYVAAPADPQEILDRLCTSKNLVLATAFQTKQTVSRELVAALVVTILGYLLSDNDARPPD